MPRSRRRKSRVRHDPDNAPHREFWDALTGWPFVWIAIPLVVGTGVGVMSLTPPAFRLTRACFGAAVTILVVKTLTWLAVARIGAVRYRILAALVLGAGVLACFGSWRWVDGRARTYSSDTQASAQSIADAVAQRVSTNLPAVAGGVMLRTMGNTTFEYVPQLRRKGVKIEMYLGNDTAPPTELQNVSGQVWTESQYLIGTLRQSPSPLDHPWIKDRARQYYLLREPVFPKMSGEWLPTLVFDLPPPGKKAIFGAQIVSKTTDYRQYMWGLSNESGKPVISGGDATPDLSSLANPK